MSVTVLAKKTVSSRSPYIGDTFQELTSHIIGRDGYMAGGITTDDGVNIIVGPVTLIQNGLIAETEIPSPGFAVPTGAEPWFVVTAVPDDDPLSGVVFSVTRDLVLAANGVVVAFKTSGIWQNPVSVNVLGASAKAAESGVETGSQPYFTLSGDNMDQIILNRGRIVDPDGIRRDLPREPTSSAKNFSATTVRAHLSKGRMDHIVLRQRESHSPETKHLIGPLFDDGSYPVVGKTGTRQGYYAKRGGTNDEQWFAYGDGLDLHIMGGPTGGGFADAILFAAASTIGEVWIAGQRALDDAIILLYTDGLLLRMVSFNAATGVQIDAPVTIDLDGNAITHVRAELDASELIHIVYERDDGGAPTQQVYYTRRATATATFAAAAITHRIVHGSPTGKNDTFPDVDVDRQGNAHIVYTTGTTVDTFGDIVYAVYDQAGNLTVDTTYLAGSAVGVQASASDGIGFVATAYTSLKKARVTVTDFDEVFAVVAGDDGGGYGDVLLFSPGFGKRLGFPIVNTGVSGTTLYGVDIVSNELGELRIVVASSAGGIFLDIKEIGLDTIFAPDGLLGSSLLRSATVAGGISVYAAGSDQDDPAMHRGTIGDIRLSHRNNAANSASIYEIGTLDDGSSAIRSQPHPKDLLLASFDVADDAGGVIPEEEIRLHNVRPKRMNYPFLVGIDGDFQGFNSVYEAVQKANVNGGEIVVRKGDYRILYSGAFPGAIALASGVTLRGEGQVVFEGAQFQFGNSIATYAISNIDGNIVERTGTFGTALRAGDVVTMATSGPHRVLAVLPPKGAFAGRLMLSPSSPGGGVPVGASLIPYPAGNRIENIALRSDFVQNSIRIYKSYQGVLREVSFFGTAASSSTIPVIDVDGAQHLLVDGADFTKLDGQPNTPYAIELDNCFRPTVRNCKGTPGEVSEIFVGNTCDTASISDCSGIEILPEGSQTTPVLVSGVDDSDITGLASPYTTTMVGSLLKTPGTTALGFQDNNTRNGPTPNIPLSSGNADGDKLPTQYKSIAGETEPSVLEALHIPQNNRTDDQGAGIVRDGIPTLGVFPQIDITSCNYFASGALFESLAQSESSATVANTVYYWSLDNVGALVRSTSVNVTNTGAVIVAKAKANPGNTAFIEFVDMRRFIRRGSRKRQIIVGPATSAASLFSEKADFFSLQAALHWLELSEYSGPQEIVIIGQLDNTNGEASFKIDLQSGALRELTIRGLGEDAGIRWGQDADLFDITGIPAENAQNLAGQKASLRIHGLMFDNTSVSGASNTSVFKFNASYFTDVSIDGNRNQSNPTNGWNNWVDIGCNADRFTIADNHIDQCRGDHGAAGACIFADNVTVVVKNLYIFRNTFRNDGAVIVGSKGIVVGKLHEKVWIAENNFEPGRAGAKNPFEAPIRVLAYDLDSGDPAGGRWIVDNAFANETTATAKEVVRIEASGGTKDSPTYVLNNVMNGAWGGGVYSLADNTRIVGNYIELAVDVAGIDMFGIHHVIADNYIEPAGSVSGVGIRCDAVFLHIVDNTVNCTAAQYGIFLEAGFENIVAGNTVKGQLTVGIFCNGDDLIVAHNYVTNSDATASFCMQLPDFDQSTCVGNRLRGSHVGMTVGSGSLNGGAVVTGNFIHATGTSTSGAGLICDLNRSTITGNVCKSLHAAMNGNGANQIKGDDSAISGNYFGAPINGDYTSGGAGSHALEISGARNAFSGNVMENRGTHANTATISMTVTADDNTLVGNSVRNQAAGADYWDINAGATGTEFGTTGAVVPGTNNEV